MTIFGERLEQPGPESAGLESTGPESAASATPPTTAAAERASDRLDEAATTPGFHAAPLTDGAVRVS